MEIGVKHFTGKSGCILAPVMAAILLSTSATADSYYGGITFGTHKFDTDINTSKDGVLNGSTSTGSIFLGKPINERVSVEAGYVDFGKATMRPLRGVPLPVMAQHTNSCQITASPIQQKPSALPASSILMLPEKHACPSSWAFINGMRNSRPQVLAIMCITMIAVPISLSASGQNTTSPTRSV